MTRYVDFSLVRKEFRTLLTNMGISEDPCTHETKTLDVEITIEGEEEIGWLGDCRESRSRYLAYKSLKKVSQLFDYIPFKAMRKIEMEELCQDNVYSHDLKTTFPEIYVKIKVYYNI